MTTTIGYFTAAGVATSAEATEIARLEAIANPTLDYTVLSGVGDTEYGGENQEFDYAAGEIPTSYAATTVSYLEDAAFPSLFGIYCQTATVAASATLTLIPISVVGTNALNMAATQLAVDAASLAWESATEAAATVADGVITGVAAGTSIITATYTFATGKTATATFTVTVTE